MDLRGRLRWLERYYLATPLFVVADVVFGANVRAAGLAGHPEWRALWYAACLGCGLLALARPRWIGALGLAESAFNLLTLALSVFLPLLAMADGVTAGGMLPASPFGPAFLVNLMLSSAACIASFQLGMHAAWRPGRAALS